MANVSWTVQPHLSRTTTRLLPGGAGLEDVHEVTYKITSGPATGTHRTVRVPNELYDAKHVRAMIQTDADNHSEVSGLQA